MEPRITYYDFGHFLYASFFCAGFQENAQLHGYHFEVSKQPPPVFRGMGAEWRELLATVFVFRIMDQRRESYFCIDARDSSRSEAIGKGFHLPLLEKTDWYFKVNYNRQHLQDAAPLSRFVSKIIPILPFFPVMPARTAAYIPRLAPCRAANWTLYDGVRRGFHLLTMPSLDDLRKLRNRKKKRDVFFVVRCRDSRIGEEDNEFRYQLAKQLNSAPIRALVGLTGENLTGKYREFEAKELGLQDYLEHIAESRVAIYVRGLFGCLSFKLGQLLALGMPIVGQSLVNNKENIMNSAQFDAQFGYDDPRLIVQRIVELLDRPEELEALRESNLSVFENKFTPKAVVGSVLPRLMNHP